jgi:hypothetical protein
MREKHLSKNTFCMPCYSGNKRYLKTFFDDKRKTAGGASSFGEDDQAANAWRNGIDRFFSKDNFAIAATKMGSME